MLFLKHADSPISQFNLKIKSIFRLPEGRLCGCRVTRTSYGCANSVNAGANVTIAAM